MFSQLTCAVIIESPEGWLLGHSPKNQKWDLPKGKKDDHESPLEAVIRECWEETGFNLKPFMAELKDLGAYAYPRKKEPERGLHLFYLKLNNAFDISELSGQLTNNSMLEMDRFAWVSLEKIEKTLNKKLGSHLKKRGLIPHKSNWIEMMNPFLNNSQRLFKI